MMIPMRTRSTIGAVVQALIFSAAVSTAIAVDRLNILWIIIDDLSPHFSCYGEQTIQTPNTDQLAREGVKFERAFVTSPICSPARSGLITGMYPTTIGAHHHQSGRGRLKIYLPANVRLVPELFRAAGYHVTNQEKADYNFVWDRSVYSPGDWTGRAAGQPFFAQIQLRGGKLREDAEIADVGEAVRRLVQPAEVTLPPYYPDDPVLRQDWADYLNAVQSTDLDVGRILQRLDEEGLAKNTYVFVISDHGISHARGKEFLYEEGMWIPFIVRGPKLPAGTVRRDLVEHIDLAATSLALAGLPVPDYMHARNVFDPALAHRDAVFAARDRSCETVDRIRAVRTERYKYIRNYYPWRPLLQPSNFKDRKDYVQVIRRWAAEGQLNTVQQLITAPTRPPEELYDLENDPWEVRNLAVDPAYAEILKQLSRRLDLWIIETRDQGEIPESAAMYESDMEPYLAEKEAGQQAEIRRNMQVMAAWADEGK
jgi:arylsulfatase A-like enzyme